MGNHASWHCVVMNLFSRLHQLTENKTHLTCFLEHGRLEAEETCASCCLGLAPTKGLEAREPVVGAGLKY